MAEDKKQVEIKPGIIIEFGSEEHRVWLGIDQEKDPAKRAALQEALDAGKPMIPAKNKKPIGKNYNKAGEPIIEGFSRRGDGTGR